MLIIGIFFNIIQLNNNTVLVKQIYPNSNEMKDFLFKETCSVYPLLLLGKVILQTSELSILFPNTYSFKKSD